MTWLQQLRADYQRQHPRNYTHTPSSSTPAAQQPTTDQTPGADWYLGAILLPPLGILFGIIFASRNQTGPALAIWATSLIIAPIAWLLIIWPLILLTVAIL